MAQQPYFFFKVRTEPPSGAALIQQTSNNTAVVTLLEGMGVPTEDAGIVRDTVITATTGGITGELRIHAYCKPGTPGVVAAPAARGTPGAGAAPAATPVPQAPAGSLTLTASPPALQTCDGSLFLAATVRDTNGKLVPDGTNVLFIATRGILDPGSANTLAGTANVIFTADERTSGTITLSAQSGAAFGSVTVPVTCGPGGASGSTTSGSLGATGSPGFRPPSTGQGDAPAIRITPPSTGEAGIKATSPAVQTEVAS